MIGYQVVYVNDCSDGWKQSYSNARSTIARSNEMNKREVDGNYNGSKLKNKVTSKNKLLE